MVLCLRFDCCAGRVWAVRGERYEKRKQGRSLAKDRLMVQKDKQKQTTNSKKKKKREGRRHSKAERTEASCEGLSGYLIFVFRFNFE